MQKLFVDCFIICQTFSFTNNVDLSQVCMSVTFVKIVYMPPHHPHNTFLNFITWRPYAQDDCCIGSPTLLY